MEHLGDAIDILKGKKYPVRRRFRDGTGCYAARFDFKTGDKSFYLVAKERAYVPNSGRFEDKELASFMQRIVERACDKDGGVYLVFYNADDMSFTVFDPHYVRREADESGGKSKTRFVAWYELPLGRGAPLRGYEASRERPERLDRTRQTGLTHFE